MYAKELRAMLNDYATELGHTDNFKDLLNYLEICESKNISAYFRKCKNVLNDYSFLDYINDSHIKTKSNRYYTASKFIENSPYQFSEHEFFLSYLKNKITRKLDTRVFPKKGEIKGYHHESYNVDLDCKDDDHGYAAYKSVTYENNYFHLFRELLDDLVENQEESHNMTVELFKKIFKNKAKVRINSHMNNSVLLESIDYETYFSIYAQSRGDKHIERMREIFGVDNNNCLSIKLKEIYEEYFIKRANKKLDKDFEARLNCFKNLIAIIKREDYLSALKFLDRVENKFFSTNTKSFSYYLKQIKELLLLNDRLLYSRGKNFVRSDIDELIISLQTKKSLQAWELSLLDLVIPDGTLEEKQTNAVPHLPNYMLNQKAENILALEEKNIIGEQDLELPAFMLEEAGAPSIPKYMGYQGDVEIDNAEEERVGELSDQEGEYIGPGYEEDENFPAQLEEKLAANVEENFLAIQFLSEEDSFAQEEIVQPAEPGLAPDWDKIFGDIPAINRDRNPNVLFKPDDERDDDQVKDAKVFLKL